MQEFFNMGGYATYVWSSYGITAVVMVVLLIASLRALCSTEATFKRLQGELGQGEQQQTEQANGDEA